MQKQEILHYPNLKTVLIVEQVIKNANDLLSREDIKRKLPTKIMHQTLNVILDYLENSGKIMDGRKGILWTYSDPEMTKKLIKEGLEV